MSYYYGNTILTTPGLVGYWKFDEASGNLIDSTGHGLTGTWSGSPIYGQTSAIVASQGSAINVNGGSCVINSSAYLNFGDTFTVEWWGKFTTLSGYSFLIDKRPDAFNGWIIYKDLSNQINLQKVNPIRKTPAVSDLNYHHYVVTKTGSSVKFYVDGVDVTQPGSGDATIADTSANMTLGGNMIFDDLAIYSTALSSTVVAEHYALGLDPTTQVIVQTNTYETTTLDSPKWRIRLANSKTFEDFAEIVNARDRQLQLYLNKPGSFTFNLNLEDPQAELFDPVTTCIKIYRNETLVWTGPVWSIQDQVPENKTQINCIGWFELLNHRITTKDLQYSTTDAGSIAFSLFRSTFDYSYIDPYWNALSPDSYDPYIYSMFQYAASLGSDVTPYYTMSLLNHDTLKMKYNAGYIPNSVGSSYFVPNFADFGKLYQGNTYKISCDIGFFNDSHIGNYANESRLVLFVSSLSGGMTENTHFKITNGDIALDQYTGGYVGSYPIPTNKTLWAEIKMLQDVNYSDFAPWIRISDDYTSTTGSNHWYWTMGPLNIELLKVKDVDIGDIPVTVGDAETTQPRTKSYPKFSNVGQEISGLSEIEAGFDFEVNNETRELNIYQQIGSAKDVHFGYNTGASNIKSLSVTTDASRMVNEFVAIGASNYSIADEETKQDTYGKFSETGTAPSVTEQLILGAYANEEVALRSDPVVTYDIVPMPSGPSNVPQPFDAYGIGDIIYFSAKKGRINIDNQAIRIFGMTVSIDDNGVETVSSVQTRADG